MPYTYIAEVIAGGGSGTFTPGGDLSGSDTSQTVSKLQGKTLSLSSLTDGYVLTYDSGTSSIRLEAPTGSGSIITLAGDLSGTSSSQTVSKLQGTTLTIASLTDGYVLTYDGGTTSLKLKPGPSGSFTAGGDLSGSSSSQSVNKVKGIPVNVSSLTDGYVLTYESGTTTIKLKPATGGGGGGLSTMADINALSGTLIQARGGLNTDASAFTGILKASSGTFSAATLVNADVSSSAAIVYSKLALSGSILNADINASAAIAYSKLSLAGSIVNADVGASAAIAGTKISPDFGSQNLVTTGVISLGTTPASAGSVRLPNASTLSARNAANSADLSLLALDSSNQLFVGTDSGFTSGKQVANLKLYSASGGSVIAGTASTAVFQMTVSGLFMKNGLPIKFNTGNELSAGAPSSVGLIRFENNTGTLLAQRNAGDSANLVLLAANTTDGYIGSDTSKANNLSNVHIAPSTSTNIYAGSTLLNSFTSSLNTFAQPIAIGTNPAASGAIRLASGSIITFRDVANTVDLPGFTIGSGNSIGIGGITNQGNVVINCPSGQNIQLASGSARFTVANTLTTSVNPIAFSSSTVAAAGQLRFASNVGTVAAMRNAGNSADLVLLAANTTDGYVGCDTSSASSITNLVLGGSTAVLKPSITKQSTASWADFQDIVVDGYTTNATITDLYTWTLQNNATTTVDVRVLANNVSSTTSDSWVGTMSLRNKAGSVSVVDAADITQRGASPWVLTLDNSGTTARVRTTGAALTGIKWGAQISIAIVRQ